MIKEYAIKSNKNVREHHAQNLRALDLAGKQHSDIIKKQEGIRAIERQLTRQAGLQEAADQ